MNTWTTDDLDRIGRADGLELASSRPDGTLRPYVTMWVVRAGDELYVRSAHGPGNGYHVKYDRYGPTIVNTVVGPDAAEVTIRLTPRQPRRR